MRNLMCFAVVLWTLACSGSPSEDLTDESHKDSFARGMEKLSQRTPASLKEAQGLLLEAQAEAPHRVEVQASVADVHCLLALYAVLASHEAFPVAKDAAARAIELDANHARAHASMGLCCYLYDRNYAEAEKQFLHAIELDPTASTVRQWYAMMLAALKRHDESVPMMRQAKELGSGSRMIPIKLATVLIAAGELDAATQELEQAREQNGESARLYREFGSLALKRGDADGALAAFSRFVAMSKPGASPSARLAVAYGLTGKEEEARAVISELEAHRKESYVPALSMAMAHASVDPERAFEWLAVAMEDRDAGLVYLGIQPAFQPLRGDPRYRGFLDRLGLP